MGLVAGQRLQPRLHVSFAEGQEGAEYNFQPMRNPAGGEAPGLSAFALQDGVVYHTYSAYARGLEVLDGAYQLLDRAPRGRDEGDLEQPGSWWRRHDEYETAGTAA